MPNTIELTVLDPRTGDTVARVTIADASACDNAIARARAASADWARTPAAERAAAVTAAAAAVRAAADELAQLNEQETGKLRADALGGVQAGAGTLVQYAELGPLHRGRSLHGGWAATDLMVAEPRGVVAVLTPWNDPVAVAAGLLGAALVTGNTVVHKPSERCARTGRRFAELLAAHLPDGVLEIVDGGVEPRWAAQQAALGAFANAGQICVSVERVYVVESVAAAFIDELVAEAGAWAGRIGPLVDDRQREQVHRHVTDAVERGARVLADCSPEMLVFREETFGPVAPVRVVSDFETALAEAADDRYGLAATVLTPDMAHAQTAWRTLPVGTVKINAVFGGAPGGASEPHEPAAADSGSARNCSTR